MDPSGDRMFGVKLIYPEHLNYPFYTEDFDGTNGRYTLMNFSREGKGPAAAQRIPTGHRALVFTKGHLIWAIEFIGPLDEEGKLMAAHGLPPDNRGKWTICRPIRFLAKMNVSFETYRRAPTRRDIEASSGVTKRSYGAGHFYVTPAEYTAMYKAVAWDWESADALQIPAERGPANAIAPAPLPPRSVPHAKAALPPVFETPPISDAEYILTRIRDIAGSPERNMEDVVKELLLRLGHDARSIIFQQGRIDVKVVGDDGTPAAIIEVKRSIASHTQQQGALRQAMDYAGRTGASLVVISDGDRYIVYDRRKGLKHDEMHCGEFRLTAFRKADAPVLDLLRPSPAKA